MRDEASSGNDAPAPEKPLRKLLAEARADLHRTMEEFDQAREAWRFDRHALLTRIEEMDGQIRRADSARIAPAVEARTAELFAELENVRADKVLIEQEFSDARALWESQRESLRGQVASAQNSVVEALTRANNPVRNAMLLREQVQARVEEARLDWQKQWEVDRQRLQSEVERLQKIASLANARESARKAILDRLGKTADVNDPQPYADNPAAARLAIELEKARLDWDHERAQLTGQVGRLQREVQNDLDDLRNRVRDELHVQYSLHMQELQRKCARLEEELRDTRLELSAERKIWLERIQNEQTARARQRDGIEMQLRAEIEKQLADTVDDAARARVQMERMLIDSKDEWEIERRRLARTISVLEDALNEARRKGAGDSD